MRWTPPPTLRVSRRRVVEEIIIHGAAVALQRIWDKVEPHLAGGLAVIGGLFTVLLSVPPWVPVAVAFVVLVVVAVIMDRVKARKGLREAREIGNQVGEYIRPGMEAAIPRTFNAMEERIVARHTQKIEEMLDDYFKRFVPETAELLWERYFLPYLEKEFLPYLNESQENFAQRLAKLEERMDEVQKAAPRE